MKLIMSGDVSRGTALEKIKRYVGLFASIAILGLAVPGVMTNGISHRLSYLGVKGQNTVFETSVATQALMRFSDEWKLWNSLSDFLNKCVQEIDKSSPWYVYTPLKECSDLYLYVDRELFITLVYGSGKDGITNDYMSRYLGAELNSASTPEEQEYVKNLSKEEMGVFFNKAIVDHVVREQVNLSVHEYFINLALIAIAGLIFSNRQKVGGWLLLPFQFSWDMLKVVLRQLKTFHDNI